MVEKICGTPKDKFLQVAEMLASTHPRPGDDHPVRPRLDPAQHRLADHPHRSDGASFLLGNIGRAGGGVNALRGHSNIRASPTSGCCPTCCRAT